MVFWSLFGQRPDVDVSFSWRLVKGPRDDGLCFSCRWCQGKIMMAMAQRYDRSSKKCSQVICTAPLFMKSSLAFKAVANRPYSLEIAVMPLGQCHHPLDIIQWAKW